MNTLTVYSTSWCPFCAVLREDLNRMQIDFDEIDIDADPAAAKVVEGINRGNRTVPTVVYADGSAATNPSGAEVAQKLAALA